MNPTARIVSSPLRLVMRLCPRVNSWSTAAGCALALVALLPPAAHAQNNEPGGSDANKQESWVIEIRPMESPAAVSGAATVGPVRPDTEAPVSAASGPLVPRMTYAQAYESIPFTRTEYEANPGYRHEAAIELMYGALRPTTVIKQNIPYFSRYPDFFRNRFQIYPYMYHNPSMNVYWNWSTNAISY